MKSYGVTIQMKSLQLYYRVATFVFRILIAGICDFDLAITGNEVSSYLLPAVLSRGDLIVFKNGNYRGRQMVNTEPL